MKHQSGFTLMELVIAASIVGILAGIAYPIYVDFVYSGRRADAKTVLTQNAQMMERNYTLTGRYDQDRDGNAIEDPFITDSPNDGTGRAYYTISFAAGPTATTFTLQAVPTELAGQNRDKCGTLTLDSVGRRDVLNAQAGYDAARCW